jgi:PKD repeat protein
MLPSPSFLFSQQNKTKPVVFVSTSAPTSPPVCAITYWRWDYGDTQFDAGNFPTASHDYNQQDSTFQVTLTVTNPAGTMSIVVPVHTK